MRRSYIAKKASSMDRAKELSLNTNPNFLIPLNLQPDGANFWWFKLKLFVLIDFIVENIKDYDII